MLFCRNGHIYYETVYLQQVTEHIYFGTIAEVEQKLLPQNIRNIDVAQYQDERLIIKGCGTKH